MALQPNGGPAPYGPPSAIETVMEAYRNRGLQTPFTPEVLVRAGVTNALAPRVFQTLRLLDLIDDNGNPSDQMQDLRVAPSDEYNERFAAVVRAAYAPIFAFANPSDGPERARDAFRPYQPIGQQQRMVTLFLGLCEYAGIIDQAPRRATPSTTRRQAPRQPRGSKTQEEQSDGGSPRQRRVAYAQIPGSISALLEQALPPGGASWTQVQRDRFLRTFEAVLDFSIPISETPVVELIGAEGEVSG